MTLRTNSLLCALTFLSLGIRERNYGIALLISSIMFAYIFVYFDIDNVYGNLLAFVV